MQLDLLRDIAQLVSESDLSKSPAHVTTHIHRFIREKVGDDPFKGIKSEYNRKVLDMYDRLASMIEQSRDPLFTATRLAIAGNIIDFGIFTSIDIESALERSLQSDIAVDDYPFLKDDLMNTQRVLYLLDNAGEILFDRLLIETLQRQGSEVTAVVKGTPVINDAIMSDASEVGLNTICRVIDNGSDAVGTILKWCSEEFLREFSGAELVISKGQGNFETLMGSNNKDIYFLFQAKCDVVARYLDLKKGEMILSRGADRWRPGA